MMVKVTQVQTHGPHERYLRTVIPICVTDALGISKGDVLSWEILDENVALLRVVIV